MEQNLTYLKAWASAHAFFVWKNFFNKISKNYCSIFINMYNISRGWK